jgi:hypothetical protein
MKIIMILTDLQNLNDLLPIVIGTLLSPSLCQPSW